MYESKFAHFFRHGGTGAFTLRLDRHLDTERKFAVAPGNLLGSIADNALSGGLADLNQYLPEGISANIRGVDFSDIKAGLDAAVAARIAEIGLPVDENDPVIKAAIYHAAAQVPARLQQDTMGVTQFIWRSQDDVRVRPEHQRYDDEVFVWKAPPEDGPPGNAYGCRCSAEPVFVQADLPEGATCERLTAEKLKAVFPKASEDRRMALAEALDAVVDKGKLDSPDKLLHFLGQAGIEMGPSAKVKEDFYYSVAALQTLDYYEKHPEEALADGYIKDEHGNFIQYPNEEAIANHKYLTTNGNTEDGDGWRFAGRGLFHTTGRYNYNRLTRLHQRIFGEFQDFEDQPQLLEEPKYAVRSAVVFWLDHGLDDLAKGGLNYEAFNSIRKIINPGESTDRKQAQWNLIQSLSDSNVFNQVCEFSVNSPSFGAE